MSVPAVTGLSTPERSRLVELEAVVDRGLHTFVEVGQALSEIREAKLYRETHPTFAAYCRDRWGFSDSRARQLIAGAKTVTSVTAAGLPAPKTEGEARRLAVELRERADEALRSATGADPGQVVTSRPSWNKAAVKRIFLGLAIYSEGLIEPDVLERGLAGATDGALRAWDERATESISHFSRFRRAVREERHRRAGGAR